MKRLFAAWAAAILVSALGLSAETPSDRELSMSLGSGLGDFGSTLVGGLSLNFPTGNESRLRLEPELCYYYDPAEPSHTPGVAVTSTALSAGLSLLFRLELAAGRIFLDIGLSQGIMHVSETRENDELREITSSPSSEVYVGPLTAFHFKLDDRSGIRFNAHILYIPWDGRSIPRLSIGYAFRY
ncbi:MAG: hypothetical protein JW747_04300 [Candidatus Aminicenantes bacterium]|nr:hypothetical protein [Candidatus Aminicenantes bacterium]